MKKNLNFFLFGFVDNMLGSLLNFRQVGMYVEYLFVILF